MTKPSHMEIAESYIGIKEIPGKKHNPKIVELFELSGNPHVKNDETAWCAAFIGGVLALDGRQGTGSLLAQSYRKWGDATKKPRYGDIVIIRRGESWQGHVFFYIKEDKNYVWGLGGNQSNMVNIQKFPKSAVFPDGYRRVPAKIVSDDILPVVDMVEDDAGGIDDPTALPDPKPTKPNKKEVMDEATSKLKTAGKITTGVAGTAGTVGTAMYTLGDPVIIFGAVACLAIGFIAGYLAAKYL